MTPVPSRDRLHEFACESARGRGGPARPPDIAFRKSRILTHAAEKTNVSLRMPSHNKPFRETSPMRTTSLLACGLLIVAGTAAADVWMADDEALHKLDSTASRVELSIAAPHARALAVDPRDNAVWVLTE